MKINQAELPEHITKLRVGKLRPRHNVYRIGPAEFVLVDRVRGTDAVNVEHRKLGKQTEPRVIEAHHQLVLFFNNILQPDGA